MFVCAGRDRYVNRTRKSNGVGKQTKRDARHRRLLKIKLDEDIPLAELLRCFEILVQIVRKYFSFLSRNHLEFWWRRDSRGAAHWGLTPVRHEKPPVSAYSSNSRENTAPPSGRFPARSVAFMLRAALLAMARPKPKPPFSPL